MTLLSYNAAQNWLNNRQTATTTLDSKGIAANMPARVKAHCFFSAKVAEAHIADKLRQVSDEYSAGNISLVDARKKLKTFLKGQGYMPGGTGEAPAGIDPEQWAKAKKITNLASTARLNLILRQNAAMAKAMADYEVGRDPDIEKYYPYWRYIARDGARSTHAAFNNMVFKKDDPIWHRIFPPWEFNCRCTVEDVDEDEAKQFGGVKTGLKMPDKPASGFEFDPATAMQEYDLTRIKAIETRADVRMQLEAEFGDQISQKADKLYLTTNDQYVTWEDKKLTSAQEWPAEARPEKITVEQAKAQLKSGIKVKSPNNTEVLLSEEVIRHWLKDGVTPKLQSDINGRLSHLQSAVATLERPNEIWEQATQTAYFKAFDKGGGFSGMMVVVTLDGVARTYFFKTAKAIDKARKGIKVKKS